MRPRLIPGVLVASIVVAGISAAAPDKDPDDLVGGIQKAIPAGETQQIITLIAELGPLNDAKSVRFLVGLGLQIERLPNAYDSGERMDVFDAIEASLRASEKTEAKDEILKIARKGQDPNQRVLTMRAAAATNWEDVDEVLIAGLADRAEPIQLQAVMGLAKRQASAGVDPLITELEKQERAKGRLYWEIHDALKAITGRSFDDAAAWKAFWGVKGKNWNPERDRGPTTGGGGEQAERGTITGRGPKLFGTTEVSSRRVVFIVDVSGSMHHRDPVVGGEAGRGTTTGGAGGVDPNNDNSPGPCDFSECIQSPHEGVKLPAGRARINRVKEQFTTLIKNLPEGILFNLIIFSTDVKAWKDKQLVPCNGRNRADAIKFVDTFQASGSTNAYDALVEAFANEQADTFYFLTDGSPMPPGAGGQVTDKQMEEEKERVLAMAREKNRLRNVKIHCMGFRGADPGMLRRLCEIGNSGEYTDIQ